VLGDAGLAEPDPLDQLADRSFPLAQEIEDAAAARLGRTSNVVIADNYTDI
jgi:hypothetical protein